jgi:hypothetical protein
MKKLVAFLFLSLLCLTTLSGAAKLWDTGYEQITDSEEPENKNKEPRKEIKEFTATCLKKQDWAPLLPKHRTEYANLTAPQPVMEQHTPPPDPSL